jgi:hypothetical protein
MLDNALVITHFIGLTLGFSVGFSNMVMAGLIARAAPHEKGVLARFAPAMGRVGAIGLALLWASGIAIVLTRYGSFSILPQTFIIKIVAVVALTIVVGLIHLLQRRVDRGDESAAARIQLLGRITGPLSLIAVIYAVITFN